MVTIIERKPKYPPIEDGNLVCYLILRVGIPTNGSNSPIIDVEAMATARKAGQLLGMNVSSLEVIWNRTRIYQYVFNFPDHQRNDKQAQLITESFLLAITFSAGPFLEEDFTPGAFRIPKNLISEKGTVEGGQLIQLEESRNYNERTLSSLLVLQGGSQVSPWYYHYAWEITPLLVQNELLRRAVRYIVLSQYNFHIYPGVIQEVLDNPDDTAQTCVEENRFEVALHNAFKAIEVIIGDPPKDESKFFARIRAIGLEPNELVGYGSKQPLAQILRTMSDARDKKSAHGSTPPKPITVGELMEYQACAYYIVTNAIEKVINSK